MKKSFLLMSLAALLFVGCDKEETTVVKDSSDFSIDGYIVDGDGNIPMEGVIVKGAFGETKTDTKGYFKVSGLNHGTYSVIFEKSGFGKMIQTFNLEPNTDTPLEVNYTASTIVSMFKMDGSMETTLWKVLNNKRVVLANVPYTINLLSPNSGVTFLYNKIEGVTDANGKISVNDTLPNAMVNVSVEYADEAAGKFYSLDMDVLPKTVSKSLDVNVQSLSEVLYVIDSNIFDADGLTVNNFEVGGSLTFNFNKSIDSKSTATLYNSSDSRDVAAVVTVSGSKLTIDPIGDLNKKKQYRVKLDVVSGDDEVTKTYYFTTVGAVESLAKVEGLTLENDFKVYEDTKTVNVEFSIVDGASYYEVFGKYGTQTEFLKFDVVSHTTSSTATKEKASLYLYDELPNMNIPSGKMFAEGNKYTIIVRAVANNGDILGEFSNPLVIAKNVTN
ncbi:carboxypeptidase family protein [Breznakibacter xylanolyticus]|uniref:Carboxypeptidase family protein n=1 Tax=Breznakibacter xylanolyticus TaxID=990 RepID=A0A2W7N7A5_9BACT|nr:carboxypeptidase regulatory-like domain-containing protein [Breznakibacter xylanolyticus]PZX12764.1 carboxypeptidase family protein [Breznakibacter xylanolyticus]